jgi:hypothetical protein
VEVQAADSNASVTLPVEGIDIGVSVDSNGFTVSAEPSDPATVPTDDRPAPRDLPTVIPPPAPPAPARERPGTAPVTIDRVPPPPQQDRAPRQEKATPPPGRGSAGSG